MIGTCPYCKAPLSTVLSAGVQVSDGGEPVRYLKGISYSCPDCTSIISIQIDPVVLNNELVRDFPGSATSKLRDVQGEG